MKTIQFILTLPLLIIMEVEYYFANKKVKRDLRKETSNQKLDNLLKIPWIDHCTLTSIPSDEGGGYCASLPLFGEKGCRGDGETPEEAIADLEIVLEEVLDEYIRRGWDIPVPQK